MGYFPNGDAGDHYAMTHCLSCAHDGECVVWLAHLIHNYRECNKPDSILHLLIPRKGIDNLKCQMWLPKPAPETEASRG